MHISLDYYNTLEAFFFTIYFKLENKRIEITGKHQYVKKNNEDRTLAYSQTLCPIKGVNTTLLSSSPHVIALTYSLSGQYVISDPMLRNDTNILGHHDKVRNYNIKFLQITDLDV